MRPTNRRSLRHGNAKAAVVPVEPERLRVSAMDEHHKRALPAGPTGPVSDEAATGSCHGPAPAQTSCCASEPEALVFPEQPTFPACHAQETQAPADSACCPPERRTDWLLWGSASVVAVAYLTHLTGLGAGLPAAAATFVHAAFEFMNVMWWGLALGIVFVGILNKVPRELVMGALGRDGGLNGILRATGAGLAFDLCSHGILLIGLKLYERGATLGQTMAFLIASPWNSISLTIILIALIGVKWTLVFIALSAAMAVLSGLIFDRLVARGTLPDNPHRADMGEAVPLWPALRAQWKGIRWSPKLFADVAAGGLSESRMILRWILFGVVLVAILRAFVPADTFEAYFGPTLLGLGLTLVMTTIIEVCSEGSSPIAADLMNRAGAPGNAFTFLMAGVATDYTEIMGLKERTRSWKIALYLPLVTVPQVLVLGYLLNMAG